MKKIKNTRGKKGRNNTGYFLSVAFKSLKRNKTISIASVTTVLTTLLILGVCLLTGLNIRTSISDIQSKVEVKVFLKDNITEEEKSNIEAMLDSLPGTKDISYESKEEALANFREQVSGNEEILEGYDENNNPLPTSFIVSLDDIEFASTLEDSLKAGTYVDESGREVTKYLDGIESIGNDQDLINNIKSFSNTINIIGIVLMIILLSVSLTLIMNTIRITIFSRRKEIGIMKFVGATDWFIRWPFIVEGIVIGISGAIISTIIIYFGYNALYGQLTGSVSVISVIKMISPNYVLTTMSWQFALVGMGIGGGGSFIAMRKFLKV